MLHIGYDNYVPWWRVTQILEPNSAPLKRLRDEAKEAGRLFDATKGRRIRSLVITDANQVTLSAVTPETLWPRLLAARERDGKGASGRAPAEGR